MLVLTLYAQQLHGTLDLQKLAQVRTQSCRKHDASTNGGCVEVLMRRCAGVALLRRSTGSLVT